MQMALNPSQIENILSCNAFNTPELQGIVAYLAQSTLNMLRTLILAYSWANHLQQSLSYNKASNISCNLLNTVPKVKTQRLHVSAVYPCDSVTDQKPRLPLPSTVREFHMEYCQLQKRAKFKTQTRVSTLMYHFHIMVNVKNLKSDHHV